ncbi:MAG TPA: T9SS type A sorting domain-containing protein [Bacteroidetes bacterium]|nr:T9SS type A sorting domain-containing protein [Bacteroidota bacterium]
MKGKHDLLAGSAARAVFVALLALILAAPAAGVWQSILHEDFERDSDTWPWMRNSRQWLIGPPNRTWGVEDSTVFHYTGPLDYRSLWASGIPNDLVPGTDEYRPNQDSWAVWGPFDLSDAVTARGYIYLWADFEANFTGAGDDFYLAFTNLNPLPGNINLWCIGHEEIDGDTQARWVYTPFNLAELDSAGDTLSYLGRSGIYLALVFQSDSDDLRGRGVFVDDIVIGYDDGQYDFEAFPLVFETADDSTRTEELATNTPYRVRTNFVLHGPGGSLQASHTLTIDGVPIDTLEGMWEADEFGYFHEPAFETVVTFLDTGNVTFHMTLDALQEQPEASEANNEYEITMRVGEPNTPPTIEFIVPGPDGITVNDSVRVVYLAENFPLGEGAIVSFFFDPDNVGFDGPAISYAQSLPVTNEQESFLWDTSNLPEGEYYLYALLFDYSYPLQQVYSEGTVTVDRSGVGEGAESSLPETFEIVGLYPNPFNSTVDVRVALPQPGDIIATWFNVIGRQVDRREYRDLTAGIRRLSWTPQGLPSGVYWVRVAGPSGEATAKAVYLK